MSEENEKNQETPEQPEVTQEPQPETPAPDAPPVETPAQTVEEPAPAPAPVPVPSPPGAPPAATQDTNGLIIAGWIMVLLAFMSCCCGSIFAIPAIILGVIAYTKGDQRGLWIIIAGAVALLTGGGSVALWKYSPNWMPNFQHRFPVIPGGRPV